MSRYDTLLERATRRSETLRETYRAEGHWSDDPFDGVAAAARRRGAGSAVVTRSGALSYTQLDDRVRAAARFLSSRGVTAQTPVLLPVGNDVDSVVAIHAVLRLDGVVLLLPRTMGPAEVTEIATRTGATVGVAPATVRSGEPDGVEWLDLADIGTTGDHPASAEPVAGRAADAPSIVLFTSGTTSRPKGVVHSLATLVKCSRNYIQATGLTSDDVVFLISPMASVTGLLQAAFIAPLLAAPVVLEDRWDPDATFELLSRTGGTWYGGPDRLLDQLLDRASNTEMPLRAVYLGGTMLERRIVERIERDFGIEVMRAYGSSEVPASTSGRRGEPAAARHADDGVPLADVEVRFGSSRDAGECCIRGPHAFLGYVDPADDDEAFEDGWFRTGDVAESHDGRVRIVGRLRDIVIRNGLKIAVAEVEDAVNQLPGVLHSAGYAVSDERTGEHLAMAVVVRSGVALALPDVIGALLDGDLAKFKLPEELVCWDEALPVNANGKVDKARLAAESAGRPRQLAARLLRS